MVEASGTAAGKAQPGKVDVAKQAAETTRQFLVATPPVNIKCAIDALSKQRQQQQTLTIPKQPTEQELKASIQKKFDQQRAMHNKAAALLSTIHDRLASHCDCSASKDAAKLYQLASAMLEANMALDRKCQKLVEELVKRSIHPCATQRGMYGSRA